MPPKKKGSEPSKKTEQKKKDKVVEDKTFGLKNKKGNKQQKYVQMVAQQVQGNKSGKQLEKEKADKLKLKEEQKRKKEELNDLFRPVDQKVGKGIDPKSVLCAFFKAGNCGKGDKCKFSHDLNIGRKGEKRNVYEDSAANEEDNMDQWDEAKLEDVVNQKHGEANKSLPKTSIICRFFLDAVESSKYGWFWSCPNGAGCHYRHALPPGFVLNKDKKKEEKSDIASLEELIEKERASLNSSNLTRVTLQSFLKWKEMKRKQKADKLKAEAKKRKQDFTSGKVFGVSGREVFEFNPDLIAGDDDGDEGEVVTERDAEEEYEGTVREITLDSLAAEELECMQEMEKDEKDGKAAAAAAAAKQPKDTDEEKKLDMAAGPDPEAATAAAITAAMAAVSDGDLLAADAPIDENLFDGEDLDLIEDELETLDLEE